MISSALVALASNAAQALGALILAMVLVGFHRLYQRPYLRTWAWSWWAFYVWLITDAASQYLAEQGRMPADSPARLAASLVSLTAGYWQVGWLLFGTFEA